MWEQWRGGPVGGVVTACYREHGERRGFGKDAYRFSRDAEGGSERMTLAHLIEKSFIDFFSFFTYP